MFDTIKYIELGRFDKVIFNKELDCFEPELKNAIVARRRKLLGEFATKDYEG